MPLPGSHRNPVSMGARPLEDLVLGPVGDGVDEALILGFRGAGGHGGAVAAGFFWEIVGGWRGHGLYLTPGAQRGEG